MGALTATFGLWLTLGSGASNVSCREISGAQLGQLPLEVALAGKLVRFQEWTMTDEVSVGFVGFAAEVPNGITFKVDTGTETFVGNANRWLNPHGVSGPRVKAIQKMTFCVE